ncbi:MAG: hypothetical protein ACH36C_07860 [Ilumatobacteraceae bacterium]
MQSSSYRTNKLLSLSVAAILVAAIAVSILGDPQIRIQPVQLPIPTTSTTVVSGDDWVPYEGELIEWGELVNPDRLLPQVNAPSPFPTDSRWRDAAITENRFRTGIYAASGMGSDQPEFSHYPIKLKGRELSCNRSDLSCAIAHSPRGDFMVVVNEAEQSNFMSTMRHKLDIAFYILQKGKKSDYAIPVLQASFFASLCSGRNFLTLNKIRIGEQETFVLTLQGAFISKKFLDESSGASSQTIVIASNAYGMPEVMASYNFEQFGEDSVSIASTKNSLLLRLPDAWPIVAQLVPTDQRWQEQTITNTEDDPLFDSVFFGKEKGIGKPLTLLQYDYPLYSDAPEGTCDLGAWD